MRGGVKKPPRLKEVNGRSFFNDNTRAKAQIPQ